MVYVGRKSEAINAFTSGEAGILMNSSGSYAAVKAGAKFQWGVALLPYWPDVKGAPQNTVIGGAAIWPWPDTPRTPKRLRRVPELPPQA